MVNANSATWLDYDRDGFLDSHCRRLLARQRQSLEAETTKMYDAGELRIRQQRRP